MTLGTIFLRQAQQKLQEQVVQQLNEQLQANIVHQAQLLQQQQQSGAKASSKLPGVLQQLQLQQQQLVQQIQLQQRQFFLPPGLLGLPQLASQGKWYYAVSGEREYFTLQPLAGKFSEYIRKKRKGTKTK